MRRVVAIGECMVELGLEDGGAARIGYAGDTFNTAVYFSRLGLPTAYATVVGGDDPFSAGILQVMAREDLDASLVARAQGRLPGLYAIERDPDGERRFQYWRGEAPVRDFFHYADRTRLAAAMTAAPLVYLSGITLAVLGGDGRAQLASLLAEARAAGAAVALDVNHRPGLWASAEAARGALDAAAPLCAFLSLSAEDLEGLDGWRPPAGPEVVERLADRSVRVRTAEGALHVASPSPAVRVVDATGAGDAFNAGYLAARLAGRGPAEAVGGARRLAEAVLGHRGAIIPRGATPGLEGEG